MKGRIQMQILVHKKAFKNLLQYTQSLS